MADFEPSSYSPAGGLRQESQMVSNVARDPGGAWRAVRGSWGLWIVVGGVLLIVLGALVSSLV